MTSIDSLYEAGINGGLSVADAEPRFSPLKLDPVPLADWDSLVAQFDGVCQEQTAVFAANRWRSLQLEPVLFRRGGDVIGGAMMMVQRMPLGLGSLAVCKWGPAARDANQPDALQRYGNMVETLIAEYSQKRGMFLSILPRANAAPINHCAALLRERGFAEGRNVAYPLRYVVDLAPSEDEHRQMLGGKWRYHLSKSEQEGLGIEEAGAERLPEFAALYDAMTARKKFPDYSAYFTLANLFTAKSEALRPALFFVRKEGEIVAGAVIFKAGDTAVYLYGATNDMALPLRAGYLMHWHIITWLKRNTTARWYDLGGSDGFSGLHQFKKQMVGKSGWVRPLPPIMHYAPNRAARFAGKAAFALRERLVTFRQKLKRPLNQAARPDLPHGHIG